MIDRETIESIRQLGLRRGKPDYLAKLASMFFKQADEICAKISVAVRAQDFLTVKRLVHQLKGSAASVGASALAQCCQQIQDAAEEEQTNKLNSFEAELKKLIELSRAEFGKISQC